VRFYTYPTMTRCVASVASGVPVRVVAHREGVNRTSIYRWCVARGVAVRGVGRPRHPRRDEAVQLVRAGLSRAAAATVCGTHRRVVQQWLKEAA